MTLGDKLFHYGLSGNHLEHGDIHEVLMWESYRSIVQPGDIVIDGGANQGLHTFPLSDLVGPSGAVYSFEPQPWHAESVRHRAEVEGRKQIRVIEKAIGAQPSRAVFHCVKDNSALSGLQKRWDLPQGTEVVEIDVEITTLDAELSGADPTFIKLDLEGGEFHALLGGEQLIKRAHPLITIESARQDTADLYKYSESDFFNLLQSLDYEIVDFAGVVFDAGVWRRGGQSWYYWLYKKGGRHAHFVQQAYPEILASVVSMFEDAFPLS